VSGYTSRDSSLKHKPFPQHKQMLTEDLQQKSIQTRCGKDTISRMTIATKNRLTQRQW
jgi:hypothetical protein